MDFNIQCMQTGISRSLGDVSSLILLSVSLLQFNCPILNCRCGSHSCSCGSDWHLLFSPLLFLQRQRIRIERSPGRKKYSGLLLAMVLTASVLTALKQKNILIAFETAIFPRIRSI